MNFAAGTLMENICQALLLIFMNLDTPVSTAKRNNSHVDSSTFWEVSKNGQAKHLYLSKNVPWN
jgi:hypothetical protein